MLEATPKAMTFAAVARRFPGRNGGHAHRSTVGRMVDHGILLPNGERIKLRAIRFGQSRFVTEEALADFLERLNPEQSADEAQPRTLSEQRSATTRACRELELMGA
ncbi:MAG: hypothetical protein K8U57_23135 [Planctomycetes bacterium]|nr:hypothetical protein [Planctomycetota bacterium]